MTGVEIDDYDWNEIFARSDNNSVTPPARQYSEIVYSYKSDGCEPNFAGVVKNTLTGSYYSFSAWTDYTGWGCRDGVEWFGPFESVMGAVSQLTQEDRRNLGFEHSPVPEDIYRDYKA